MLVQICQKCLKNGRSLGFENAVYIQILLVIPRGELPVFWRHLCMDMLQSEKGIEEQDTERGAPVLAEKCSGLTPVQPTVLDPIVPLSWVFIPGTPLKTLNSVFFIRIWFCVPSSSHRCLGAMHESTLSPLGDSAVISQETPWENVQSLTVNAFLLLPVIFALYRLLT